MESQMGKIEKIIRYTHTNSIWMRNLNINNKAIQILEGN